MAVAIRTSSVVKHGPFPATQCLGVTRDLKRANMPIGVIKDRIGNGFNFRKGDVVRLRSGGPLMTIESFQEESIDLDTSNYFARCVWFENGDIRRDTFNEKLLQKGE
jgi:uncharacterized protein YodC (DUF2158 family)